MKKFCCALFATLLFFSSVFADTNVVSNVTPYQEGRNIVIEYDLAKKTDIFPFVSVDGGVYVKLQNVYGDVGRNVEVGHRRIVWDVLSQYERFDFDDVRFKIETGKTSVRDICGNTYPFVTIGKQVWMAENMRCNKYDTQSEARNASWLTNSTIPTPEHLRVHYTFRPYYTDASDKSKWSSAVYSGNLSDAQVAKLGYLYNWAAAVGVEDGLRQTNYFSGNRQGICPNGWHIPSKAEWDDLKTYIDPQGSVLDNTAGKHLKTTSGWYDNGNGTDTYGFATLPADYADGSSVGNVGRYACFWTATPSERYSSGAYGCFLGYSDGSLYSYDYGKSIGHSVRCLRD